MGCDRETLRVIMPVYNKERAVGGVLDAWCAVLDELKIDYRIFAYNDGSRDGTLGVLRQAADRHAGRIDVIDKRNEGHGPTILRGYCANVSECTWLFQTDSDDEMNPSFFRELWAARHEYDFLIGIRDGRRQPLPRKVISLVSRLSVRLLFGRSIWDVNAPFRLMRCECFGSFFEQIPSDTFAPNVILSGLAARKRLRCFEAPVEYRDRTTGEVSIKKWKLFRAAFKSFQQTIHFALAARR